MKWLKAFWKALNTPAPVSTPKTRAVNSFSSTTAEEVRGNFTPRAQQVLALARNEADRFNHNFVGTEHVLLGLIAFNEGVAVNVLRKLGLDLESLRKEIETQVGIGPDQKMIGDIPYTPRVKKVLALADKERKALNHTYVGTEHLLLGLLREGDGVAARVLLNFNINIERTRLEILKELDPNFTWDESATPSASLAPEPAPAPTQLKIAETVTAPKNQTEVIDLNKRYDVYCSEQDQETVVYRNAAFKGVKRITSDLPPDVLSAFYELEQANGDIIFINRLAVIKFCAPGATPSAEKVTDPNA